MSRAGTFIVVGLVAFVAYQVGARQTTAVSLAPTQAAPPVQPVGLVSTQPQGTPYTPPVQTSPPAAPTKQASAPPPAKQEPPRLTTKEKAAAAVTAAAIAALLVQASRQAYYASGRPCACPDDSMRNGARCGNRSAYSKPGGAEPLCYETDVTTAMIENYRKRVAVR
jgi:hypothetical protein